MSPDELVELQKLLSTYGDPTAATGPTSGARAAQAEAVARAARASATHEAIDPATVEPPPPTEGGDGAPVEANGAAAPAEAAAASIESAAAPADAAAAMPGTVAPVEHYDDLEADEIVSLLDSLEDGDLHALREYERGAHARPRVLAAIDAVVARRAGGPVA